MNLQNIPVELQTLKQWVCVSRNSKIPMMPSFYCAASSTDSDTWGTFREAVMSVECGNYDNVGFVFNNNGVVGIDVDAGFDEDGFLTELAADIIGKCKSYSEKSRSGRGFHIFIKGTLPFKGKNNLAGVEMYQTSRFFIMTGDILIYDKIIENQEAIDDIVDKYFSETHKRDTQHYTPDSRIYAPQWIKSDDKIRIRPVYPRIPNGCRNISLTSLAGALHNQGYSSDQIYDEIMYCNKVACDPVLPASELKNIVRSITRYKR